MSVGAVRLLRDNRALRRLGTARVISFAGDTLSLVALMLYVVDTAGKAIAVSALLLAGEVVPAVASPLLGALADRIDARRVMIGCELAQGALLLVVALTLPPLPVLLALVALRAAAGQVFGSASRAALPALVADDQLPTANSVLGLGTNGAEAAGPVLAAALLPFTGVVGVLLVDAASFAVSALLLRGLPPLPAVEHPAGEPRSLLREARAGVASLWSVPAVRIIALGFCAVVACTAIDDVALVVLATDTLRVADPVVALLLAAVGVGLLVGYLLLARVSAGLSMVWLMIVGFAVSSAGNLFTGVAGAAAVVFILQAVRGLGIAAMDVAINSEVQRLVPAGLRGRVFANLYGAVGAAAALSYVAGGLLLDATSAPTTFVVAGAGGLVATTLVAVTLPIKS
jgi:MFS family permease